IGNAPWRGMRDKWNDPLPGNLFESDSQVGNPQFIDAENGDFHLKANSPCISSGRGNGDIGIFPWSETAQPILSVFPSNINFGYTNALQTFYITNVGSGDLNWNVSENAESIKIQSAKSGHLGLNQTAAVSIQIDRNKLAAGTSYELLTLVSNGGARMLSVSAENGTPPPEIAVQRDILLFTGLEGGPNPLSQTIQVDLTNATGLAWQAMDLSSEGWLDINRETLSDSLGAIRAAVDISDLPAGFYVSKISINSPNNEFEPVYVQIHLFLNSEAPPLLIAEMEAENGVGLSDENWAIIETDDQIAIEAVAANPLAPDSEGWLDYQFTVPENISEIYIFTEYTLSDTTQSNFCWLGLNENVIFRWQSIPNVQDEWRRAWVSLGSSGTPIAFPVTTGQNTLRLNPGSTGMFLNWLVVSSDPNLDISQYGFGQGLLPISAVEDCHGIESAAKPATDFSLLSNYPNPFNPTTTISFTLNQTQMVTVAIYNSLGQYIKTLGEQLLSAGTHQLIWDGLDKLNQQVQSGIYLARLQTADNSRVIKMTLLK
ncbi:T9SS type A sorting domain-containing protein, partial [bacterium]|nr:T9SS type A sorting domain-containing protein [bacterium]